MAAWHRYFKGDACDPTPTVSAKPEQVPGPDVFCFATDYIHGVGTRSRATMCPTWTDTSFVYRGFVGNMQGTAPSANDTFSSNFCKCDRNLDLSDNRELCYDPGGDEKCALARSDLFLEQSVPEAPDAPWKHITTETAGAAPHERFFPSTWIQHSQPGLTAFQPKKQWLFSQDQARLWRAPGTMKGILSTHGTGSDNYRFNYRPTSTNVHILKQGIFIGPPKTVPHKWIPRPSFDFPIEYRLPLLFGEELRLFTSDGFAFMDDITSRLSSSAQSLYRSVAEGGQILQDDAPPDHTLHDAIVIDDKGRFLGAFQTDGRFGTHLIGADLARFHEAPLPGVRALTYSAARRTLYTLTNNDLVIRNVTTLLDGGPGRTVLPLYGDVPLQLEDTPAPSTQMVWLEPANALMLLNQNAEGGWDLTSVGVDGECRLLWSTTALPEDELAHVRLGTSPLGELVLTSSTALITFNSRGEPLGSSAIDAPALANVASDDQSFHYAAYAAPPDGSLLDMAQRTVARDAMRPGLCAAAWLQGAALSSPVLDDAWRTCEPPTAASEPGITRCLSEP